MDKNCINTIWVYGCSFSEPFNLPGYSIDFNDDGTRNFHDMDFWGTYLAEKLNMKCITKSRSGYGWNYINDRIDEDILKWNKNDIIIISPSYFVRVTCEEFISPEVQIPFCDNMKDWSYIYDYNEIRWRNKIKTLQYFGYNVYTWLVDETKNINDVQNLIFIEDKDGNKIYNFKYWMDLHKEYWLDINIGDWHFNEYGHIEVSNIMYNFIIKNNSQL